MLRFDRMLRGSLSALDGMPGPGAPVIPLPGTPDVVAPDVPAPAPGAVGVAALSAVGAVSSVLAQPAMAATRNAAMIHLRMKCLLVGRGHRGSGPQAGSRTSAAGETSRCLMRPSEDTPANIPRDPCCAA